MENVKVHHVYVHVDHEVKTRLDSIDQAVANMTEMLREVLDTRQVQLNALAEKIERSNAALAKVVEETKPKE